MVADWIAGLNAKTGRTLEQWLKVCSAEGPAGEAELRDWLKKAHNFGTNGAGWIAERSIGKGLEDSDPKAYLRLATAYVAAMYSGNKAGLWPVHDALEKLVRSACPAAKLCPAKTIVPVYRTHVIAQIKPASKTRISFGLALGDVKGAGRLIETGGYAKKDRITHKIEIGSVAEVDGFVEKMLRRAWDWD